MVFGLNVTTFNWINFVFLVRARWAMVLLVASGVLLAGAFWRNRCAVSYEATVQVVLAADAGAGERLLAPDFRPSAENELARAAEAIESAAPLDPAHQQVRVGVDGETRTLSISARDRSPGEATTLANQTAVRFAEVRRTEARKEAGAETARLHLEIEKQNEGIRSIETRLVEMAGSDSDPADAEDLRRRLTAHQNLLRSLEAKHQLSALKEREADPGMRVVAAAAPESAAAVTSPWLTLPALLGLGVLAGIAVAVGLPMLRGRSHWSILADLVERLQLGFAGFAPLSGRAAPGNSPVPAPLVEPYRDLRNRLLRLAGEDRGHIVALMPLRRSDRPAEAIANLAGVLADAGRTVLVIDADFRSPALHSAFEAARHPGLADFLSGEMRLEETVVRSRKANLWFMPSGPLHDDPGGLLNGRRMADLVGDMRRRFDFVLVASPSIHTSSDAGVLAHLADSTAVVTAYSGHSVRSLRETAIALDLAGSALAAVILTVPAKQNGGTTPQNLNPSTPQSLPAASTNGSKR